MSEKLNISGEKFGRLTVLRMDSVRNYHTMWKCRCECGNEITVQGNHLTSGHTQSCGCLQRERASKTTARIKTIHGHRYDRIYKNWMCMKSRCGKRKGYENVSICDEWAQDFMAFRKWSMENGYKEGLTIDRINVYGNYEPSNCRWATAKQQMNNRRNNRFIDYDGERHTIAEWSEIRGIPYYTIRNRLSRGCTPEQIMQKGRLVR